MNFDKIKKALKFARAPKAGIAGVVERAGNTPIHHQNSHDLALHDYLMDHEDPRHLIVGKHLSRTQHGHPNGEVSPGFHPTGEEHLMRTPDGIVALNRYAGPGGQSEWESVWNATHPDNPDLYRQYHAILTPEEANQIRTGLDAEHTGFHFTQPPTGHDHLPALHSFPVDLT